SPFLSESPCEAHSLRQRPDPGAQAPWLDSAWANGRTRLMRRFLVPFRTASRPLAVLALALGLTAPSHAGLITGLAGYYQFNGNGADSSGNGRDVSLVGGAGFAPGLFGQALDLHANNSQFAQRPVSDAAFNFGSGDFTIQTWFNFNSTPREQTLIE